MGPLHLNESIRHLKEAVKLKHDRASVHNNLGLSYFEKGDFEESLQHYTKALTIEPSAVHFNNRGLAFYHINRLYEAKEDFDKAIQIDPHDPTVIFNRGNVFLIWQPHKRFQEAHQDYDRALEIAPGNAKLWHAKGLAYEGQAEEIYQQTGEQHQEFMQLAIEMYQEALKLQDNFVSSRFHLGLMYHKTNKFQEALKCFSKVLAKIPHDKTVYISRGVVYQDMGNHQQAIKDFSKACTIDP